MAEIFRYPSDTSFHAPPNDSRMITAVSTMVPSAFQSGGRRHFFHVSSLLSEGMAAKTR